MVTPVWNKTAISGLYYGSTQTNTRFHFVKLWQGVENNITAKALYFPFLMKFVNSWYREMTSLSEIKLTRFLNQTCRRETTPKAVISLPSLDV